MKNIKSRSFLLLILLVVGVAVVMQTTSAKNSVFNFDGLQKSELSFDGLSATPQISTERNGDVITVSGENFGRAEQVSLFVEYFDISTNQKSVLARWDAFTDKIGRFETSLPISTFGSLNARFTLTGNGTETKLSAQTYISNPLVASANLDQCGNGGVGDPDEACTGMNWVNGNVNENKGHWVEGDSVAYRMVLSGFTNGSSHTVTIGYDTTKAGKHAIDYLTSFDRTETQAAGNDPCSGVGCNLGTFTTMPIPLDQKVMDGFDQIPGNSDDITQIPGVFTLFGGTITGVSAYSYSGSYAGDSHTAITITFTAGPTDMALAWGGHIGRRADWGFNNSAIAISGSPYHMTQDSCSFGCGGQDRALSAGAAIFPADVTIIKDAQPGSPQTFNFSSTGQVVSMFGLVDNGVVGPDRNGFTGLTNFGAGNSITVTEDSSTGFFTLIAINCTSNPNGGAGTNNNTTNLATRNVVIVLEEGESVTCTFVNAVPNAALVSVGGRVLTTDGIGISRANVSLTDNLGNTRTVRTNAFGYYRFDEVEVGGTYFINVRHKQYQFNDQIITVNEDLTEFDITASP